MAAPKPITPEEFDALMPAEFTGMKSLAVGVSGGPDSLALCKLLSDWADGPVHALIVDHGLRSESEKEVEKVKSLISRMSQVKPNILKWEGKKPETGIQEEARKARYELMAKYCKRYDIRYLFLAHHQDDQAETFLFRLAKGSGLDGLAAMKARQEYSESLTLIRPLLNIPKDRLVAICDHYGLGYIQDPSNESDDFARVRLRKSTAVLEEEGLTPKRLSLTAQRLSRARQALEKIAEAAFSESLVDKNSKRIVLNYGSLMDFPEEIAFRIVLRAIRVLRAEEDYAPRMEKVEDLFSDLMGQESFRRRTLGGLIFERDDEVGQVILLCEDEAEQAA